MANKRKVPMRKCVGCGEMKPKTELLWVLRPVVPGFVVYTPANKHGRGAYICYSRDCFQKAVKNKGLERSFKQAVPAEVYGHLEKEMEEIETG